MTNFNMNFGEAISCLKNGRRVARDGWNGKGMWLALVLPLCGGPGTSERSRGEVPSLSYEVADEVRKEPFGERLLPFIAMKTVDGKLVPWLASQTDMLAEDWGVVDT